MTSPLFRPYYITQEDEMAQPLDYNRRGRLKHVDQVFQRYIHQSPVFRRAIIPDPFDPAITSDQNKGMTRFPCADSPLQHIIIFRYLVISVYQHWNSSNAEFCNCLQLF